MVTERNSRDDEQRRAGLCAECVNARRIQSDRGAVFWLCELSATDSRFAKYPRLPVIQCVGFEQKSEGRK